MERHGVIVNARESSSHALKALARLSEAREETMWIEWTVNQSRGVLLTCGCRSGPQVGAGFSLAGTKVARVKYFQHRGGLAGVSCENERR